jgi:hypothetical protein
MSAPRTTPPRPCPALRVGVTGHRLNRLLEPDVDLGAVVVEVRAVLAAIQEAARAVTGEYASVFDGPPQLILVSPLAEGTDQIVAEAALDAGFSLHVPLPTLPNIYTGGFQRPARPVAEDPCAGFVRLCARASAVQILDGTPTATLDGAAYAAVGRTVLRHADVLIAVWDGSPAEGAGGTAAVIDQARSWQVPIVWIDPRRPQAWRAAQSDRQPPPADVATVVREVLAPPPADDRAGARHRSWLTLFGDGHHGPHGRDGADSAHSPAPIAAPLRQYLDTRVVWAVGGLFTSLVRIFALERPLAPRILALGYTCIDRARLQWDALWTTPTPVDPAIADPISRLVRDYYTWADGLADRFGTLNRDLATAPYVLAPIAVLASVAAQVGLANAGVGRAMRTTIGFAILLLNFLVYLRVVYARYHDRWIDCRSLAEQLRHLAFLWPLGRPLRAVRFGGEAAAEAPRFAWIGWYARAVARQGGLFPIVMTPEMQETWRHLLVERFIRPQHAYHERARRRFQRVTRVLHRIALGLFAGAMALSAIDCLSVLWGRTPPSEAQLQTHLGWAAIAGILAIMLPAVATGVHGFQSQGDFSNLSRRSDQMCQTLDALIASVADAPPTMEGLGNLAEDAADAMRDELLNWRVFARLKSPALV